MSRLTLLPPLSSSHTQTQFTGNNCYLSLFVKININIWVPAEHGDIGDRLANPQEYASDSARNLAAMSILLDEEGMRGMPSTDTNAMSISTASSPTPASDGLLALPSFGGEGLRPPSPFGSSDATGNGDEGNRSPRSPRSRGASNTSMALSSASGSSLSPSSTASFSLSTLGPDASIQREMILQEIAAFQLELRDHVKSNTVTLASLHERVASNKRILKANETMRKKISKNDAAFEKQRWKAVATLEREIIKIFKSQYREVVARRADLAKAVKVRSCGEKRGRGSDILQRGEEWRGGSDALQRGEREEGREEGRRGEESREEQNRAKERRGEQSRTGQRRAGQGRTGGGEGNRRRTGDGDAKCREGVNGQMQRKRARNTVCRRKKTGIISNVQRWQWLLFYSQRTEQERLLKSLYLVSRDYKAYACTSMTLAFHLMPTTCPQFSLFLCALLLSHGTKAGKPQESLEARLAAAKDKGYNLLLDAELHFLRNLHDNHIRHLDENIHALEKRHSEMFTHQLTTELDREHSRANTALSRAIHQRGEHHMTAVRRSTVRSKQGRRKGEGRTEVSGGGGGRERQKKEGLEEEGEREGGERLRGGMGVSPKSSSMRRINLLDPCV